MQYKSPPPPAKMVAETVKRSVTYDNYTENISLPIKVCMLGGKLNYMPYLAKQISTIMGKMDDSYQMMLSSLKSPKTFFIRTSVVLYQEG